MTAPPVELKVDAATLLTFRCQVHTRRRALAAVIKAKLQKPNKKVHFYETDTEYL